MYLEELFGLNGKVILVTGGSKGIGKAVSLGLAKAGADIAVFSRNGADETVQAVEAAGRKARSYIVDVTKEAEVEQGIQNVLKDFGSLNGVFNNVGAGLNKDTTDMTAEEFRQTIDINLVGEFIVARTAGAAMLERGINGSIVNNASMSGHIVNNPSWMVGYNSSKAGIIHMTRCLAAEWAKKGIRVNSISPGYIEPHFHEWRETWIQQVPMGRLGEPEELIGTVICLLSDSSSYTTGADIVVDGGYCCL